MSPSDVDPFSSIFLFLLPIPSILAVLLFLAVIYLAPGGLAWSLSAVSRNTIPGPPGILLALSTITPHRILAHLAHSLRATRLMAFSVGLTRFIISTHPSTARDILNSPAFADRPVKDSAHHLLFRRAIGFSPSGDYWRRLRRITAAHLFSPKSIASHSAHRADIGRQLVAEVNDQMRKNGVVRVRPVLQFGSLNNVMWSVLGRRYEFGEGKEVVEMVREGYELLGEFNWGDYVPLVGWWDLQGVRRRCGLLARKVEEFVGGIIEEKRMKWREDGGSDGDQDFVDVLLGLEEEERLSDADMIAVLWEMIFRGTDTVAILLEWIMARLVLHPDVQSKAQAEITAVAGNPHRPVSSSDVQNLHYLQCIVKETLRMHPPGPLLSWARLAIHDVNIDDHFIPAGTTAMVNMWAIAHDEHIWPEPEEFKPERFMIEDVSILGSDMRLAPFGSGRRVCPGKAMGLATVHLWLAQLLQSFDWLPSGDHGVDLSECLKMSLEMENPLVCRVVPKW